MSTNSQMNIEKAKKAANPRIVPQNKGKLMLSRLEIWPKITSSQFSDSIIKPRTEWFGFVSTRKTDFLSSSLCLKPGTQLLISSFLLARNFATLFTDLSLYIFLSLPAFINHGKNKWKYKFEKNKIK